MDNSDTFNFEKFILYLESIYTKMPPFGKPRAFIDNFKAKTLLPFEINKQKRNLSTLPNIKTKDPHTSDWR